MSTLAHAERPRSGSFHPFAHLRDAWSGIGSRQLTAVVAATLLTTLVDSSFWIDKLAKPGVATLIAFDLLASAVLFSLTLLSWVALTHEQPFGSVARRRRLVSAVFLSGFVAACFAVAMVHAAGLDEIMMQFAEKKKSLPPAWAAIAATTLHLVLYSAVFVAIGEMLLRRRTTRAALQAAQKAQAEVARGVLESRLAAMQAQVEPQFLFDTLVDIEAQYRRDAGRASDDLDRLITYLRVALPRLRESGSYVEAEIDLVSAYLDVVRSLRGGRPELKVAIADDCRCARFYPMLLLPLVQRAVRRPEGSLPEWISIEVGRAGAQVQIVLTVAQQVGCAEDAELARVRERLSGLYGERGSFRCDERAEGATVFTIRVPDDPVCDD